LSEDYIKKLQWEGAVLAKKSSSIKDSYFRELIERTSDIVFIYRFRPRKALEYISPSVKEILGYAQDRFYNDPGFHKKVIHQDDQRIIKQIGKQKIDFHKPHEIRVLDSDGHVFWYEASITPVYGKSGRLLMAEGILRDISKRKKAEEKLTYLSFHDSLTKAYNRAYYMEEVKRLDTERQLPLSIIMADVNGLKLVNDAFGHDEGDNLLKSCVRVLKRCCRADDIVARFGGDEFSMLLPRTGEKDAKRLLDRIKMHCDKTDGNKIPLSISMGTSTKVTKNEDFTTIIRKAEEDMYQHKLKESKSIIASIISSLETTLFEKSIRTESHFRRLKQIVVEMGKKLKLSEDRLDDLRLLATIHDIGKVAILDSILNKRESLSENEWQVIKKHPEIGYRIAMSSNQLSSVAEYILTVHEHWDGTGYPQGLKGGSIPLISRIMALADSYVIMREGRPYRKARTKKEAIAEIKKCRGTQFDPRLVDIFLEVIKYKR